ncbi:MAG: HAMP domain-containing histidine kinase [Planctomycetaceae bacterium]|nr:HAMP domain-containing histidine kinase [Planctomycetaceae bacterium]
MDRDDQPFEGEESFALMARLRDPWGDADEHWNVVEDDTGIRRLQFYSAVRLTEKCAKCHADDIRTITRTEDDELAAAQLPSDEVEAKLKLDRRAPLKAVIRVNLSLENVDNQLSRNRAVLLASAIVTSFLAMLAAYGIVRYIIVKPVIHLKQVSDEIARGNLNLRAEINTGDEFEELSHAFNRMLRHMMTVNDELRALNENLDAKVDQLAQANMELFNNNKLKDDFLATMSHELRTPLNSILGFSDILQTAANLDDRQRRYVSNIQTSGQSLMVQINDLLDLAKIESGKMEVHPGPVRLPDVIEQQVQQILPLADRKNIDLRTILPSDPLPVMQQDRGKISQILNNLLSNAIKFTPEGGRVRVACRRVNEQMAEFSVEDTGIGIPLPEQEQIFEKFRQGSTTPGGRDHVKREYEGTGLGLSIVRELSRLLGGDVTLESEFGKGSLFVVRLPFDVPIRREEPAQVLEPRTNSGLGRITSVNLLEDPPVRVESAVDAPPVPETPPVRDSLETSSVPE